MLSLINVMKDNRRGERGGMFFFSCKFIVFQGVDSVKSFDFVFTFYSFLNSCMILVHDNFI